MGYSLFGKKTEDYETEDYETEDRRQEEEVLRVVRWFFIFWSCSESVFFF